ncbi:hypothetical protein CAPTEDRAFT_199455 [Capitella teleta]|uniref:Jacalin-type lectin domain-containing protein n=1 Tax=Capitella teleta TaxID=283909 RepID=R7VA20_CAPTE|nr:hypothetical protein CAPTEDRAFT_199455 [Capitella teleta]|eukprot:ELU15377.1 hypothetical protein CAPTEDRAFT_199455 [Capitella teleta]
MQLTLLTLTLFFWGVEGNFPEEKSGHFLIIEGNRSLEKFDLGQTVVRDRILCAGRCLRTPRCSALGARDEGDNTRCELYEVDRRHLDPNGRKMYINQVNDYEPCQADFVMGYPDDLLPIDAKVFDDRSNGTMRRITGINVWAGYIVDRVQVIYDGEEGPIRGTPNAGNLKTMQMLDGEVITKVVVQRHDGNPYVSLANLIGMISISTNMGNYQNFGWGGGSGTFTLEGSELRWISGWHGNRLYRINFAFMEACHFSSV